MFFIFAVNVLSIAEENLEYKQIPIKFENIKVDSLDSYISKNGKLKFLNMMDSTISKVKSLIKHSTLNIKQTEIAIQLKGINDKFKLNIDSFLIFDSFLNVDSSIGRNYGKIYGNTEMGLIIVKAIKEENIDFNKLFVEEVFKTDVRNGLYVFCNYLDNIKESSLDTLYKAALIYPNVVRNEYYYALAEFDRNCGNAQNNAAFYKTQLYNKMKEDMSLEKALTDTNKLSAINASKYILTPKYQFFAYSLYAKNFDIKNNQKEVIYFLSSQNTQDGGFREYNLEKAEKNVNSKIEPTFYAFWALLELREQINALYPDDVVIKKPTSVDTTIKTPTKPAPKKK